MEGAQVAGIEAHQATHEGYSYRFKEAVIGAQPSPSGDLLISGLTEDVVSLRTLHITKLLQDHSKNGRTENVTDRRGWSF